MIREAIIHFEYFKSGTCSSKVKKFKFSSTNNKYSEILSNHLLKIKMEANFTKYIVSKLNALGVCNEELDDNSLENTLHVFRECQDCQKGLDQIFQTGAKSGNFPLCKFMLQNMGNLNPADEDKATAFHYAAENGHLDICCLIIKYLKHKNPGDVRGFTPFDLAAMNGHLKICELILRNVADKNPKGFMGWTPLHFAAQNGHLEVCKLIMGNTTKKNPENMCGQTPKSLADDNYHEDISELIDDATGFKGHPFELSQWFRSVLSSPY